MPLHRSGLVSRHALAHPDEPQAEPLPYERVLKYNPNHGPDGRFTSGGGGRRGGTAGAPTEDAFGRPLRARANRRGVLDASGKPALELDTDPGDVQLNKAKQVLAGLQRGGPPSKGALRATRERFARGQGGDVVHRAAVRHGYDSKEAVAAEMKRRNAEDLARAVGPAAKDKWLLDIGKEAYAAHPENNRAQDKIVNAKVRELAKQTTSWDEAISKANMAEDMNYHKAAEIFRSRADQLNPNLKKPQTPHAMRAATIPSALTGNPTKSPYTIRDESNDTGFSRGGPPVTDPNFHRGGPPVKDPKFHIENPALPGFRFSNEQRRRHAKEMFGSVGERAETYRQSGKLPVGTIHYSDQTLIPTGKKGVSPARNPVGTIYSSDQTLVPSGKGTYIDKATGQIYRSNAVNSKAQLARDAAKQAAYVAAYGKKNKVGRR